MKTKSKSIFAIGIFALALACSDLSNETTSETNANGHAVGEIRGTASVNKQILNRALDKGQISSFNFRIEQLGGNDLLTLAHLLGAYVESGAHHDFKGGEPNPFGMLMWHQVSDAFAKGIGSHCKTADANRLVTFEKTNASFTLHKKFSDRVLAVCNWGDTNELRTEAAKNLWNGFVGFGAAGERKAFIEFFASETSPFAKVGGEERVSAMITAMVLNPHFLLEK